MSADWRETVYGGELVRGYIAKEAIFSDDNLSIRLVYKQEGKLWLHSDDVAKLIGYKEPIRAVFEIIPNEARFKKVFGDFIRGRKNIFSILRNDEKTKIHEVFTSTDGVVMLYNYNNTRLTKLEVPPHNIN